MSKVHDYHSFFEEELIGKMPVVYQSVKGLMRNEEELKNMLSPVSGYVAKYRSDKMTFYSSYKNLSKMYVK